MQFGSTDTLPILCVQCHETIHALWRGAGGAAMTMQSTHWYPTSGRSHFILIPADIVRRKWCRIFRNLKYREALARADLTPRFKTSTRELRYHFANALGFRSGDLAGRAHDVRIQSKCSTHRITLRPPYPAHHSITSSKHQMKGGGECTVPTPLRVLCPASTSNQEP